MRRERSLSQTVSIASLALLDLHRTSVEAWQVEQGDNHATARHPGASFRRWAPPGSPMSAPVAIRNAVAACLVFASPVLWASSLPVPVDAKVVEQRPAVEQERVYPLGPLRRISGRLRVEDKVESRGQVSSVTYELPVERTAREA